MALLQVALDFDDKKAALKVAKAVKKYVDIFEAGTPLVKSFGEKNVIDSLKKIDPKKPVFADLKTMDTGAFEAKGAFEAGADYSSVLGVAAKETVKGAVDEFKGKAIVVDLIECKNVSERIVQLKAAGAKCFEVHTAIDEQKIGMNPLNDLEAASKIGGIKIWVAGGVNYDSLESVMKFNPDVVVVGGAITHAKNPRAEAKRIREKMNKLQKNK